jgi:aryl-alcohol dehydrogenase-like predicted oxidoreductase
MQIGLGCVGLGSGTNRRTADDIGLVRAAIDLGVTVFDTADVYGSGASEHVLGRAVRSRRDEVTIATKGGFVFRDRPPTEQWARRQAKAAIGAARSLRSGSNGAGSGSPAGSGSYTQQDFSARHLRDAVHASLRRLATDRIDVYQLHGPEVVVPELFDELADLVSAGDVVRFGVGAGSTAGADAWIGVGGLRVLQVPFGVLDPEAASSTLPLARQHDLEVWARGVLGGGLFGLADRDPAAIAHHPKRELVAAIRRIAGDAGLDPYQLAFGFLQAHADDVSTVLVGTSSRAHLARNIDAVAAPALPDDVLRALTGLVDLAIEQA